MDSSCETRSPCDKLCKIKEEKISKPKTINLVNRVVTKICISRERNLRVLILSFIMTKIKMIKVFDLSFFSSEDFSKKTRLSFRRTCVFREYL